MGECTAAGYPFGFVAAVAVVKCRLSVWVSPSSASRVVVAVVVERCVGASREERQLLVG